MELSRYICLFSSLSPLQLRCLSPRRKQGAEIRLPIAAQPRRQYHCLRALYLQSPRACDSTATVFQIRVLFRCNDRVASAACSLTAGNPCQRSGNATRLSPYQLDLTTVSSHALIPLLNASLYIFCLPSQDSPSLVVFPTFSTLHVLPLLSLTPPPYTTRNTTTADL